MKGQRALLMALAATLLLAGVVVAQGSARYEIPWDTVASGGEEMASANWAMVSRAGQRLVGGSASGNHGLEAAFWVALLAKQVPSM